MGWGNWGDWGDVPSWTLESDHGCIPDGILFFCNDVIDLTLHEADFDVYKKGRFLAYSWGVDIPVECGDDCTIDIPLGGHCWAECSFLDSKYLPSSFRIEVEVELNGACVSVDGQIASLGIYVEVDDLNISDRVEDVDAAKVSGGVVGWNHEILNYLTDVHTISTPGTYAIKVRFHGESVALGDGAVAASSFNNRYSEGYYVKLNAISVVEV